MNVLTLLDMAVAGMTDRIALGSRIQGGITYRLLFDRVQAGAAVLRDLAVEEVVYLGVNGEDFPVAMFAAAAAEIPLVPLNYRLGRQPLAQLLAQHPKALVISDSDPPTDAHVMATAQWRERCDTPSPPPHPWVDDANAAAVLIYTSGTTSAPKAAVLRHRHMTSYLLGTVEFGGAGEEEAVLVSVPPYHIAGVTNLLSNIYAGRRIVYLESFDARAWLDRVRTERITHALLVPTMLAKITEYLADAAHADVPSLRSLAYGGAKMPLPILERAVRLFPNVDFVNAYGLTETSSTIAVLGPEDHRAALNGDPVARLRLGSVGRVLPGIEVQIRGPGGELAAGRSGEIHVRGPQVSGEYRGIGTALDAAGWFPTRDRGWVDADGFLFVEGRSDDTIIRGGENIAPAEIEDALLEHPAVAEAAVVGVPDEQWGHEIAAAIVLRAGHRVEADELRSWVRLRLRSSKTPAHIVFRDTLPQTPTGKILRREVQADLTAEPSAVPHRQEGGSDA
ncbi:class I adenylate-forming enzyme family protein [Nocardia miyunensis]|uniref:class I adenylate-forming enzyme family protein n=1 Tax=Nocardia miyunensis TaxID=282684 RepID=UPI0008377469|nr:class I adenylate-forming enzyme family protein [Nocardia miyunensis]